MALIKETKFEGNKFTSQDQLGPFLFHTFGVD
jgi:hypothetical protein